MRIVNFGSCNIDYVYFLDHIVVPGETETTKNLETFPGGKGLNQSIAAVRAGAKVYHVGNIGNDGKFLQDLLHENGVDVSYLKNIDSKNGHAVIQVSKSGDNSIFLYPGSNEMLTMEYIDETLENFSKDDMVLLQNEVNYVDYIIEKAYEKNMAIVLNPSPFNEKISKIDFNKLYCLILNEIEAKAITGYDVWEDSLNYFKDNYPNLKIMLTLGAHGSVFMDSQNEIYQTAYEVEAVDTTAAGDTFTGFFVAGIAREENFDQILKVASAASALSVSRKGAAPSIPTHKEVIHALTKLKSNKSKAKPDMLIQKINLYIEQNIKNANLCDLAEKLGYSVVYSGSIVKKLTGMPFSKYLHKKRCEVVAQKLCNSNLSVEEIISSVGYENKNFFRKIFKEQYGENPLHFRKSKGK